MVTAAGSSTFEQALARLDADPVERARYVAHYDGDHDPMDALAWAARPGSVGPSGAPDPFHSADDLQRLAFGRSDEAAQLAAQLRIGALQEAARGEVEAVRRALEGVERDERVGRWHPQLDTRLLRLALRTRESRPAMTAAVSVMAIAFAGLAVLGYATQLRGSLTVFDRPMSSRDESAPSWVFGNVLEVDDTTAVRWIGTNSRFNLYGVLGRDGDVCLAIVEPDVGGTSECTSADEFAAVGHPHRRRHRRSGVRRGMGTAGFAALGERLGALLVTDVTPSALEAGIVLRLRAAGSVFAEQEAALLVGEYTSDDGVDAAALDHAVHRRTTGEPLEIIVGWAEFCGLRLAVAPGVFVPRPRSAFLVEHAVALARPGDVLLDLCCGVGAIAAAVAARVPGTEVHAAELDPVAAGCAARNLPDGHVVTGDLFDTAARFARRSGRRARRERAVRADRRDRPHAARGPSVRTARNTRRGSGRARPASPHRRRGAALARTGRSPAHRDERSAGAR